MPYTSHYLNVPSYKAPELAGADTGKWFNSPPLHLTNLKGKVVLIDFWTYSCINCIRSLPYLQAWYDAYKDSGLVVIGVHAPEFEFEKLSANVERAIQDRKLTYPIVQDNDFKTWRAYDNHYWPAHYLIDKQGRVRREHFGEGEYDATEKAIRTLLTEPAEGGADGADVETMPDSAVTTPEMVVQNPVIPPIQPGQTPETYLGYERGARFANRSEFAADKPATYTLAATADLNEHEWSLGGVWQIGPMDTTAVGVDGADSNTSSIMNTLRIKFSAKEVYLVMDGPEGAAITLMLDGKAVTTDRNGGQDVGAGGRVRLDGARLYRLVSLPVFARNVTLDVSVPKGVTVNAFTFGG